MDLRQSSAKTPKLQGVADCVHGPGEELGYTGSHAMNCGMSRAVIVHDDGPPLSAKLSGAAKVCLSLLTGKLRSRKRITQAVFETARRVS
jgi:hypothetical protein